MASDHWPLFGLFVRTPRIELRYANDDLLLQLAAAGDDVIRPGGEPFEGDASFYDRSPAGRQRWLRGQWSARAKTSPEWWVLVFVVVVDGQAVGAQEMTGSEFSRLRTVSSFSWLVRESQGHGVGKEMRAAMLHLAFEGLGAERALSEAFIDNAPSIGVSRAMGYVENGREWYTRPSGPAEMRRFLLTRASWQQRRRSDIEIGGLAPCLPLLGLS
jgi:RimJ/RimL family protein N-acetyltransferase